MSTLSPERRDLRSPNRTERLVGLQAAFLVPPLVARVLRDERYYGDGPPTWPSAPTSKDARKSRNKYFKRLRRFSSQFPRAKALAKVLARCKRGRRCMSGACPECGRALQKWFVAEVTRLPLSNSEQLVSISIAFPKHRVPENQLTALDSTTSIKRALYETVKAVDGLAWIAGGIDLSLNDDALKGGGVFWQPQFYGIAAVADPKALAQMLRKRFAASKAVPRPVQIKHCDGSAAVISYALKPEFVRRIAYPTEVGPPGHRRNCWHTRKVSLRPPDHVKALLWMHRTGFAGRLYLRGVRMTRTGNGVGLIRMRKLE